MGTRGQEGLLKKEIFEQNLKHRSEPWGSQVSTRGLSQPPLPCLPMGASQAGSSARDPEGGLSRCLTRPWPRPPHASGGAQAFPAI